jgi:hypothetical protein
MGLSTRVREGNFRVIFGRMEIGALIGLFRSIAVRPAWPSILRQRFLGFFEPWRPVASVGIEDEDVAVFEGDLDRLAGVGALVEQVEAWFPFVGWNPFADGLPRWFDGLEGARGKGQIFAFDISAALSGGFAKDLRA